MTKMIFVNLPVANLPRSIAFYESIGAVKNSQFTDETAACMVLSDSIHVMLLTHDKFRQFTPKPIADARTSCAVLLCVSAESRAGVDDVLAHASGAGAKVDPSPAQEYGFMYGRSFEDLDGHVWDFMWMDVAAMLTAMAGQASAAAQAAA